MPLPLSPKRGFGMNVAVLPAFLATFLTTYLNHSRSSAILVSVLNLHADLALPGGRDLVVADLDDDAGLHERGHHVLAQIVRACRSAGRGSSPPSGGLVPQVRLLAGVPVRPLRCRSRRTRRAASCRSGPSRTRRTRPRGRRRRVGEAGRAQVRLGLLRDVAGVAAVRLARDRVDHLADEAERLARIEGIEPRRRRDRRDRMSLALMGCHPRIDEPSKPMPSSNSSSSSRGPGAWCAARCRAGR
jgi:hypothetical protein